MAMTLLRSFLRALFRQVVRIYFRELEVVGQVPEVTTGGRLFGANHVNGLVDPVLVMTTAPCPMSPLAKAPLWDIPGLRWLLDVAQAVPIVRKKDDPNKAAGDNDAVFTRVAEHLASGGNLLLFPEGTSHNEPHLVRLRSGAGRMLAAARRRAPSGSTIADLSVQAVGLEFDARDTFRSRCLVVYGAPRRLADLVSAGASDDEVAAAVTAALEKDLGQLVIQGETWEDRLLVARVAELFAHDGQDATFAGFHSVGRRVEMAQRAVLRGESPLPDELKAQLATQVSGYYEALGAAGLGDEAVARLQGPRVAYRIARSFVFALVAPVALLGFVLYAGPYRIPRWLARRAAGDDQDAVSTYKLGAGLVMYPLWTLILAGMAAWRTPWPWSLVAAGVVVASPFAALAWMDRFDRWRRTGAITGAATLAKLRERRAATLEVLRRAQALLTPPS